MILQTIKNKHSTTYICKCDLPGCENTVRRVGVKLEKVQYCCVAHRQQAVHLKSLERKEKLRLHPRIVYKITGERCIVCGKPKDETFYDKSNYRPICSKECYSLYFNSLPYRSVEQTPAENTNYSFYKQGHLVLRNYDLVRVY